MKVTQSCADRTGPVSQPSLLSAWFTQQTLVGCAGSGSAPSRVEHDGLRNIVLGFIPERSAAVLSCFTRTTQTTPATPKLYLYDTQYEGLTCQEWLYHVLEIGQFSCFSEVANLQSWATAVVTIIQHYLRKSDIIGLLN